MNNTDVNSTANKDTTLCCIPNASKLPTAGGVMIKYSLFTALFCMLTAFTWVF